MLRNIFVLKRVPRFWFMSFGCIVALPHHSWKN